MQHICPACGTEYELGPNTLPECPECIRRRMVHPDGLSDKHKPATNPGNSSYIADGVNPKAIYDYMSGGSHIANSGCEVFYAPSYGSFNAVSYKPLGQIPGSGDFGSSGPTPSQFAVWVDLRGNSKQGTHLNFEDEGHLNQLIANGEWVHVPKCSQCGQVRVYNAGDVCLNCQVSGGGTGS